MGKKKVKPPPMPLSPTPPGAKMVRLELDEPDQLDLRRIAADRNLSMAAMARAIVLKFIEEWRKSRS